MTPSTAGRQMPEKTLPRARPPAHRRTCAVSGSIVEFLPPSCPIPLRDEPLCGAFRQNCEVPSLILRMKQKNTVSGQDRPVSGRCQPAAAIRIPRLTL